MQAAAPYLLQATITTVEKGVDILRSRIMNANYADDTRPEARRLTEKWSVGHPMRIADHSSS